jgi:hypothetical protein
MQKRKNCKHPEVRVRIEVLHKQTYEINKKTKRYDKSEDEEDETHWDTADYECAICGTTLSEKEFKARY